MSERRDNDTQGDQELRRRLRRIDPARRTPASTEHELAMLVLRALSADRRSEEPVRPRRRWRSLVAATSSVAAIVLIVLVARPGGGELSRARLAFAPSDVAASCAPLTPASLTRADLAFEASVERVSGSQVVLRRGETFKGSVADELLAEQQPAGSLVGPFRTGQRYFLAVKGGRVLTCGESALATPRLRAIYDRAF